MRLISLLFVATLLLAGCASGDDATTEGDEAAQSMTNGTVRYVDLEGGFYGIEGEDGTKFNPTSLPEAFREDGLAVRFRYRERGDVMSTQMWGRNADILEIERR